jgi:hypothetical protein
VVGRVETAVVSPAEVELADWSLDTTRTQMRGEGDIGQGGIAPRPRHLTLRGLLGWSYRVRATPDYERPDARLWLQTQNRSVEAFRSGQALPVPRWHSEGGPRFAHPSSDLGYECVLVVEYGSEHPGLIL